VWKGQKMAGHMGNEAKTVLNLLVVLTDPARNLIFIEGSVPGAGHGIVTVEPGRKPPLKDYTPPAPLAVPAIEDDLAIEEEHVPSGAPEAEDEAALDEAVVATDEMDEAEAATDAAGAGGADAEAAGPDAQAEAEESQ